MPQPKKHRSRRGAADLKQFGFEETTTEQNSWQHPPQHNHHNHDDSEEEEEEDPPSQAFQFSQTQVEFGSSQFGSQGFDSQTAVSLLLRDSSTASSPARPKREVDDDEHGHYSPDRSTSSLPEHNAEHSQNHSQNDDDDEMHDMESSQKSNVDDVLTSMAGEMSDVCGSQSVLTQEMVAPQHPLTHKKMNPVVRSPATQDSPPAATQKEDSTPKTSNTKAEAPPRSSPPSSPPKRRLYKEEKDHRVSLENTPKEKGDTKVKADPNGVENHKHGHTDEDATLTEMERSGAMTQVIGSQSILSQEIALMGSQPEILTPGDDDDKEEEEEEHDEEEENSIKREAQSNGNQASAAETTKKRKRTHSPALTARKYGLIGEAEGGKEDEEDESKHADDGDCKMDGLLSEQQGITGLSQEVAGLSQETLPWPENSQEEELRSSETQEGDNTASQSQGLTNAMAELPEILGQGDSQVSMPDSQTLLDEADKVADKVAEIRPTRVSTRNRKRQNQDSEFEYNVENHRNTARRSVGRKKAKRDTPAKKAPPVAAPDSPRRNHTKHAASHKPASDEDNGNSADEQDRKKMAAPPPKRRPRNHQKPNVQLAAEAAALAESVVKDENLEKKLLLSMVKERQPTRTPPSSLPGRGHEMHPSFVWSHYPPMEKLLKDHMEEYYTLSLLTRQSAAQQTFNNKLVRIIRGTALKEWGWKMSALTDKALRDRIRCYYKTHIQNAKKRLATMLKNPRKVANARHLVHHLQLIQSCLEEELKNQNDDNNKKAGEDEQASDEADDEE